MAENKSYFGPLTLHQQNENENIFKKNEPEDCLCFLCESKFSLPIEEKPMLTHFFMEHRLVIADVNQIADLKGYVNYWKIRFQDENLPHFCTTMLLDEKPDGTKSKNEEYFLLSDVLPEDKELRSNLQQTRLENLLKHHQFEREDRNYKRECLFCRFNEKLMRADYLKHLYEKHNFHIAKPDNLIFVDDLIDLISNKLENLQCIFCEKYFKDRTILKEHMRKKGHKRINPDVKEYDKFFIVNYLEGKQKPYTKKQRHYTHKSNKSNSDKNSAKNAEHTAKKAALADNDIDSNVDSDPDWSEWTEETGPQIMCLFCQHSELEYDHILDHMERSHDFSFTNETVGLNFYHKIKIVNYIRRQVHVKQCLLCETTFDDTKNLEKHLKESKHIILEKSKWDQPEFYFPTYEDDLFLCYIQDDDENWWKTEDKIVEEEPVVHNISKEVALSVLED